MNDIPKTWQYDFIALFRFVVGCSTAIACYLFLAYFCLFSFCFYLTSLTVNNNCLVHYRLSPERQSARMSDIENSRLGLDDTKPSDATAL